MKKLIQDMIMKLENEAAEASSKNEWCTKETKKSNAQKESKDRAINKLTARISEMQA